MPLVSVVIPSFNAAAWIRDAIRSVAAQEGVDTEIIVVDDGSTDDTIAVVKREFPSVRLFAAAHQGVSRARNIGTRNARGAFVQYLDADDILGEYKLKTQLELLVRTGADVAYGDWQELVCCADGTYRKGARVKMKATLDDIDLFTDAWCPPAVYLFRRSIVDKVGHWNERLPVIQDARFALDCALHGGRFIYQDSIAAYYRRCSSISLSRRNPEQFLKDCLRNADEVCAWWQSHGGMDHRRKQAVLAVYGFLTRQSFREYPEIFEEAYRRIRIYMPRYIPARPLFLGILSWVLGYRRAEATAYHYRRLKKIFLRNY